MKVLKLKQDDKGAWIQDKQLDAADITAAKLIYKDDGKGGVKYKLLGDPANEAEYRKRGWL